MGECALRVVSSPWSSLTLRGDDSSVLLYAVGRLGIDDPRLEAEGSSELAHDFKVYAPGP